MGSRIGILKTAAQRLGLTYDEYISQVERGLKHCTRCKCWHPTSSFGRDRTRHDDLDAVCHGCRCVAHPYAKLKGRVSTFKGHKHTEDTKRRLSLAKRDKPSPKRGIPRTPEERIRISKGVLNSPKTSRGDKHYAYSHGKRQRNMDDRRSHLYREWRAAVFARDGYKCQDCGDSRGGNLRAHHIQPFAKYPEGRFNVTNGITLCHHCHELRHFKPNSTRNIRKLRRGEKLYK
jgi:5-methylcytosine-specific restriction endonuclease McrA